MNGSGGNSIRLDFDRGSLVVMGIQREAKWIPSWLMWDKRMDGHRCLALRYRALVRLLMGRKLRFFDGARQYAELTLENESLPAPYPHQQEALKAWSRAKWGVVELPTGAGKTFLALRAICAVGRDTLILAPTLELVSQWCSVLESSLGVHPGVIGGGSFDLAPITVCTYASAYRKGENFGARFCLAIFDECHHMGGRGYARIGEMLIAPYRLGLSATPRSLGSGGRPISELIGPIVYRRTITELSGRYLAEYRVEVVSTSLNEEEKEEYARTRGIYLAFVRERGLSLGSARGWQKFVYSASRSPEGRAALDAYYRQRQISFAPESKIAALGSLLRRHKSERVLIFTNDNETAYAISRRFLIPIITHQTRMPERRNILKNFRENRWPFLVTSKVLNEGVDVPEANVAVILSGSASVREHVQRLGRILRKAPGKEAILYEVLSSTPGEKSVSARRRKHDAYR